MYVDTVDGPERISPREGERFATCNISPRVGRQVCNFAASRFAFAELEVIHVSATNVERRRIRKMLRSYSSF